MIQYDQDDLNNLALVTWKEARGEGNDGMRAVMHVIINRVGTVGFPHTLHDVIFQKNAFTSMSVPTDPEFNLQPQEGDVQYAYCQNLAVQVLNGTDPDLTANSHYYADLKYTTSGWFFRNIVQNPTQHPHKATIGRQDFYDTRKK